MSPETATTHPWCKMFSNNYVKKHLVLIAVDEAHCISDWSVKGQFLVACEYMNMFVYRGCKFRPSFEKIGGLRALTNAPVMALRASASGGIQHAIVSSLHLS